MCKKNIGFPQQLVGKCMDMGKSCACNELLTVKYRHHKNLYVLSTIHFEAKVALGERGASSEKQKPASVSEYIKYMQWWI